MLRKCSLVIDRIKQVVTANSTPEDVRRQAEDVIQSCETIMSNLRPSKIAVYGGMGVGKSRFINKLLCTRICDEGGRRGPCRP